MVQLIIDTLNKSEVFSCLKDEELKAISSLFDTLSFKNNETIFSEGDASDKFYILAEGNVKILKHTMMGKDIILEIMSPGDIFGGVAVLDNKPFPASANAMKSTSVIKISRQIILYIIIFLSSANQYLPHIQ